MDIEADKGKEGLKTAISELHDPADPVPGAEEAEQLHLPTLPLEKQPLENAAEPNRGRGRPPGAKNKNTEEWRRFILSQHRSPLEALAQTYGMTVEELARRLGASEEEIKKLKLEQRIDLFKIMLTAAKELAPYVHQKMPQAVDLGESAGLIQLTINTAAAKEQGIENAGALALKAINEPDEENQLVSDADFEDAAQSRHNADNDESEEQ